MLFLRFALGAGIDFVRWYYTELRFNIKTGLDLKFGPVSLGVSGSIPVDVHIAFLRGEDVSYNPRILAAQPTVNLIYWFGRSSKSRRH